MAESMRGAESENRFDIIGSSEEISTPSILTQLEYNEGNVPINVEFFIFLHPLNTFAIWLLND